MNIVVNGMERAQTGATLEELWEEERRARGLKTPRGFAMALNGALVKRDKWPDTRIAEGDRIEIVRAFAGG